MRANAISAAKAHTYGLRRIAHTSVEILVINADSAISQAGSSEIIGRRLRVAK